LTYFCMYTEKMPNSIFYHDMNLRPKMTKF
jgi:hypothetical protein